MAEHTKEEVAAYFGEQMRFYRAGVLKLSRPEFADLVGIDRSSVRNYESGRQLVRLDVGMRIARACGVRLDAMLP